MLKNLFFFTVSVLLLTMTSVSAEEQGELIFTDDFERSESQEAKDQPGNGWGTNSRTRAKGNKQVDLRDGAMYIYIHKTADHGVSVTHTAEFKDGAVGMRFMLKNQGDSLGLNFADLQYKQVHAGHLFVAKISTKSIQLQDLKTGNMDLKIREARKAKATSESQNKLLKTKALNVPHSLEVGKWYDLLVTVEGDLLSLSIDGEELARFQSEGIAHPTKRLLRLAVPKNAVVDDVNIWRKR
tara:strand:- start:441 stop:1160 length:720 start_codon:yes stop_codon:yes gene_type:complete